MKRWAAALTALALLVLVTPAEADEYEEIFEPDDHCVAYRSVKDMLFAKNVVVVGVGCEVSARLVTTEGSAWPHVIVEVPVKSLKSGNVMRNYSVSDILGSKNQPNLQFSTEPLDVERLRRDIGTTGFTIPGQLTIAGVGHRILFPVEVVEHEGRRYVRGRLSTSFAAFGLEAPRAAGGLIARVHEELDLLVHIDLTRVEGLADILQ